MKSMRILAAAAAVMIGTTIAGSVGAQDQAAPQTQFGGPMMGGGMMGPHGMMGDGMGPGMMGMGPGMMGMGPGMMAGIGSGRGMCTMMMGHTDGRLAYLKAELKITDAQAPQFERVAQAMRENATAMDQAMQRMRAGRDQQKSAVDRLEARTQFATLRAQSSQRFLDAFKPLYASLSADQKKAADEMLARHGHGHGRF
jgi:LTXXQ motif family protein